MNSTQVRRWLPIVAVAFLVVHTLAAALGFHRTEATLAQIAGTVPIEQASPISSGEIADVVAKTGAAVTALIGLFFKLNSVLAGVAAAKRKALGLAALFVLSPGVSSAQTQQKRAFSFSFETGLAATWTEGVKDERAGVILLADVPIKRGGWATRVDIAGSRGQTAVDLTNPSTFRSTEILSALYIEARGGVDAICFGGVSFSLEGSEGRPVDARMYTGACGVRIRLAGHSLILAPAHRGAINGPGFVGSLTLAKGEKGRVHVDAALGARRGPTGAYPWELRSAVTYVAGAIKGN